jgi:hypothetical protein
VSDSTGLPRSRCSRHRRELARRHFLTPESLKQTLAFSHDQFTLYTLFTAAYVNGQAHLVGNIVGYLLTTLYTYMLCIAVDERRWFWRTFVVFLLVLPVLVSLTSYAVFSAWFPSVSVVSRGFSGVVAGFGGFLLVALAVYIRKRYSAQLGIVVGTSSFLTLMAMIDYIYAGRVRLVVGGLLAVGIALEVGSYLWQTEIDLENLERQVFVDAGAVGLVFVVLAHIVVAMFPAEIAQNGTATNIIAHAMGFLLGVGGSILSRPIWP